MDVLYVFRHSPQDDVELRYSLRSVATYLPYIRKVWVFGDRPGFLSDDRRVIEHVSHESMARVGRFRTPVTNFFLMLYLSSLIPELDREYLWFCDDFILLEPLPLDEARHARYLEDMSKNTNRGTGLWKNSLWRTYDLLRRLGYPGYNFETHTPTYFTKKWVFEAYCAFQDFVTEDRWQGMLGQTAVLNHAFQNDRLTLSQIVEGQQRAGIYGKPLEYDKLVEKCRGRKFLSFDDAALNSDLRRYLAERFPTPCIYERREPAALAPRAANLADQSLNTAPVTDVRRYPTVLMPDRGLFGELLNTQGLVGEGAEVGVGGGEFSERLLRTWKGRQLHCIDAWKETTDDPQVVDVNNVSQEQLDRRHAEAQRRLAPFAARCTIHRQSSSEAAEQFTDGSLDFVYLDTKHYRAALLAELNLWVKKVRPGGYLAGHDYLDGILPSGHFEVKSTLDAWAHHHGLTVACSGEHVWRSWFIRMP